MRPCYNMHCENGKEVDWLDNDTKVVTYVDCHICKGTGEVEDVCYCHAYEPNECCCGAWSLEDTENWYDIDNGLSEYNDGFDWEYHEEGE